MCSCMWAAYIHMCMYIQASLSIACGVGALACVPSLPPALAPKPGHLCAWVRPALNKVSTQLWLLHLMPCRYVCDRLQWHQWT
jgi:hypothetical protein